MIVKIEEVGDAYQTLFFLVIHVYLNHHKSVTFKSYIWNLLGQRVRTLDYMGYKDTSTYTRGPWATPLT